jgi:hypothetical protein
MISNEDPTGQRAFKEIAACTVVNSLVPLGMLSTGMLHPVFMIPFYYYQSEYIKAVFNFKKEEGSANGAKRLKKTAYMPFVILLAGFMVTTGYNRHQKRK